MTRVLLLSLVLFGVGAAYYWLGPGAVSPDASMALLSDAETRRREVVREVATSFEKMAADGKPLPVPSGTFGGSATRLAGAPAWSGYAAQRGMVAYLTELGTHGDSSPESAQIQRLVALDRFGTHELPEASERFARESLDELRRSPGGTLQAIGRMLDGLPVERDRERRYLLQLASRLESVDPADPHAAESHARLVGILREEISRGGEASSSEGSRTTASAAVMELVAMGEALPDVSELSARDAVLDEVLKGQAHRDPAASGASAPSANAGSAPQNDRASGPAIDPGESPDHRAEDARAESQD